MDDQPNLREFLNEVSSFSEEQTPAAPVRAKAQMRFPAFVKLPQ